MSRFTRWILILSIFAIGMGACKSNQKTIKKGKPIPCPQKDC